MQGSLEHSDAEGASPFLPATVRAIEGLQEARADDAEASFAVMSQARMSSNRDFSAIHGIDIESAHAIPELLKDVSEDALQEIVRLCGLSPLRGEQPGREELITSIASATARGTVNMEWLKAHLEEVNAPVEAEMSAARWAHQRMHAVTLLAPDLFNSQGPQISRQGLVSRSIRTD
jgi:hypothetical protein